MTKSDVNLSTEEVFPIRSYGKGELACLYICLLYTSDAADD